MTWISTWIGWSLLLVVVAVSNGNNGQVSASTSGKEDSSVSPAILMNDILFKNMSESFSAKEMEDAMISLNRTKRQSLNLLQLAQLAGLGNLAGNNNAAPAVQNNNSNNNGAKSNTEGKKLILETLFVLNVVLNTF